MSISYTDVLESLKSKSSVTREDIANLLASIDEPGASREVKIDAVSELGIKNFQGIRLEENLEDYQEF